MCLLLLLRVSLSVREQRGKEKTKEERNDPGGLAVNGLPTKGPRPTIQSLPSAFSEPVAFIQMSSQSSSSAAVTATTPCSSHPAFGSVLPGESRVRSSKSAPSSPVHSPIHTANAASTSLVARRSLNAVAPSVCMSGPRPRRWSLTFLFSAYETFDATAIVIVVIPSTPLALGDRWEVN